MAIQILDPLLSNQIAAGEVVERPASVVKELVENSIDAGAASIVVEIEHGGQKRIVVRDDGDGIEKADLALCLHAHATSKIATLEDLFSVGSLGFRGEALASIAAVSRLKITSRHVDADQAWRIESNGSEDDRVIVPAAHPKGTTVNIGDLFFNTPARKKFMKKETTEFRHIESILQKLALGHMNIAFKLVHNDKVIFQLPAAISDLEKEDRVAKVLGGRFLSHALEMESNASGMRLAGWVALPEYNRSQMDQQYFYLNGRFIRDKMLTRAVKQAYQDVMFHGRFSAFVLYFEVDPTSVDVNVHPTKSEVRFRDGRSEFQFIVQAVKSALNQTNLGMGHVSESQLEPSYHESTIAVSTPAPSVTLMQSSAPPSYRHQQAMDLLHEPEVETNAEIQMTHETEVERLEGDATKSDVNTFTPRSEHMTLGSALAQLHDIYILAQNDQGLVVVDMHAGHERVQYERMKKDLKEQRLLSQPLLIPVSVNLHPEEMNAFLEHETLFRDVAIVAEVSGPQSIVIREVPSLLKDTDMVQLTHDLLADILVQSSSSRVDNLIDTMLGNMACKSAIKAHHRLSIEQMNALLRDMEKTPHGGLCNHGRPAWKQICMKEVDQWFLRGQ